MKLKIPDHVKLVAPDKVKTWRVEDRERYIDKVLMDILITNTEQGATIADLESATRFDRRTISTHLANFVTRGEVYKELMGKRLAIYKVNGQAVGKPEFILGDPTKGHYFKLYRLENDDGKFIYVQERQIDDFKKDMVKGVITVRDEEIEEFIKKLHAFALRVRADE